MLILAPTRSCIISKSQQCLITGFASHICQALQISIWKSYFKNYGVCFFLKFLLKHVTVNYNSRSKINCCWVCSKQIKITTQRGKSESRQDSTINLLTIKCGKQYKCLVIIKQIRLLNNGAHFGRYFHVHTEYSSQMDLLKTSILKIMEWNCQMYSRVCEFWKATALSIFSWDWRAATSQRRNSGAVVTLSRNSIRISL